MSYLDALQRIGLTPCERGIWATVGDPGRDFGWKLHLASVQGEAEALIDQIGPLLRDRGMAFKVAASDEILGELNEGTFGASQVGKFATLYPRNDAECVEVARQLLACTACFCGPRIITDLALGNIVYARYGRFARNRAVQQPKAASIAEPLAGPVVNPFADWPVSFASPASGGKIGPGFVLTTLLRAHAGRSVSLAMDLRAPWESRLVVLKKGTGATRDGLRGQHRLSETLAGLVRLPAPRALFEQGESLFLALDYVEGRDFSERSSVPFCSIDRGRQRGLLTDFVEAADTLAVLHRVGVVHRGLSPDHVRVAVDGKVWLLDLDSARPVGERGEPPIQGDAGYLSPEQRRGGAAAFTDDVHAFGGLLANALTGVEAERISLADDGALPERLAALSGAPGALIDICARMLSASPERRPGLAEIRTALVAARAAPSSRADGSGGQKRGAGAAGVAMRSTVRSARDASLTPLAMSDAERAACQRHANRHGVWRLHGAPSPLLGGGPCR